MPEAGEGTGRTNDAAQRLNALWRQGSRPDLREFLAGAGDLAADEIVAVCRIDQRARWQTGERVPAEAYLDLGTPFAGDPERTLELIYAEYLLREELGDTPALAEYQRRFPPWAERLGQQVAFRRALESPSGTVDHASSGRRYELLGEIGRGGMGVVYRARQPGLSRIVALKMILTGEFASTEDQARFRREAETAGRLQHPNIVQVYEVGEQDGRPFLAMEYVDGGSLADRLNGAVLAAQEAARLVETLARAVQYAHEHGVLHRDLKPANILIQRTEDRGQRTEGADVVSSVLCPLSSVLYPKITDFGLAKRLPGGPDVSTPASQTQTGNILGTPSYMAPEQAGGSPGAKRPDGIGPAADVWALGAILYEAMTGRPPFRGETAMETLQQVLSQEPLPPSQLRPKLARDLETICLKCLQKDPRGRYARAGDLANDLELYLANRPIQARPVSAAARTWRWCQRKPAVATLAAALAVVGVASLVGLTLLWLRAERHLSLAQTNQQRAQASYQLARASLEESLKKVADDPRLKSGPLEDLRRTVLQAETIFYQKFVELQGDEPDFQAERARAFTRLGDVTAELGQQEQALAHFHQAQEVLSTLVRNHPAVPQYQAFLAANQCQLAKLSMNTGQLEAAEQNYQAALAMQKVLTHDYPEDLFMQRDLARTYMQVGRLHAFKLSRAREEDRPVRDTLARSCEGAYQEAAALFEDLDRKHPTNPESRYLLGTVHISLGSLHREMGRLPQAEQNLGKAGTILKEFIRDHADHEDFSAAQKSLAGSLNSLASVYQAAQRWQEAERAYREALAIQQDLVHQHPLVLDQAVALGNLQSNLGNLMYRSGQPAAALDWRTQAIATLEAVRAKQPRDLETRAFLRDSYYGRASALNDLTRHAEALANLDRALELDDGRFRLACLLGRALTLAHLKEPARAVAAADALVAEAKGDVQTELLFWIACVYAMSAEAVSSNEPQAEHYAARAVALLRQARAAGFKDVERLKTEIKLEPLRTRGDFKSLVAETEKAAESKAPLPGSP